MNFRAMSLVQTILLGTGFFLFSTEAQAAFQEQIWGARPAGLAGAFTAMADDANGPAYNPAGISLLAHSELTLMHAQLYSGLNLHAGESTSRLSLNYGSFVPQVLGKKYGSFAFSWSGFDASQVMREDSFTLTYADSHRFSVNGRSPILAYGVNLKYLKNSYMLDDRTAADPVFSSGRSATGVALDLGVIARPHFQKLPGLKFGLSAKNLNEPDLGLAASDRVPLQLNFGVAYQELSMRALNPALEFSQRKGRTTLTIANESWFFTDTMALRMGVNDTQFGGGAGYQFRVSDGLTMRLDYSILIPMEIDETNGSHRFSITANF